jgi:hypothetical protein
MGSGRCGGRALRVRQRANDSFAHDDKVILERRASFLEKQLERIRQKLAGAEAGEQSPQ